ncbi:putative pumilio homolog 8, chloroplastic isoform X1 [Fagus crenata]
MELQLCIVTPFYFSLQHILNEIAENCLDIAINRSGCCLLQECIAYADKEARDQILVEIAANALLLSEHPFGNYVVQYILGLDIIEVTANILAQFEGNILDLSMNKFSSHVVEKCLKELRAEYSTRIIVELISNPELFQNVVQDYFGNYVIQSALAVSQGAIRQALVRLIHIHCPNFKSHLHGAWVTRRNKHGHIGGGRNYF